MMSKGNLSVNTRAELILRGIAVREYQIFSSTRGAVDEDCRSTWINYFTTKILTKSSPQRTLNVKVIFGNFSLPPCPLTKLSQRAFIFNPQTFSEAENLSDIMKKRIFLPISWDRNKRNCFYTATRRMKKCLVR